MIILDHHGNPRSRRCQHMISDNVLLQVGRGDDDHDDDDEINHDDYHDDNK